MATDPVCHMMVDERSAKFRAEHDGEAYYFCSAGCMNAFRANPAKYAR